MGGSGGIFGGDYGPEKYKEIIQKTREQTRDAQFETNVNGKINNILGEYHRKTEVTTEHINNIKEIIEQDVVGTIEMCFGGSVSKHTYVDGLSDVDVLILIDKSELSDASPHKVLEYIKTCLTKERHREIDNIHIGTLAVTVRFTDGEKIQLLPALKRYEGYKIPEQTGNNWSNVIRPDKFARKLTKINQNCKGKVVPVVKLAKDIISRNPIAKQLSGYHIESIAVEVFKLYPDSNPKTPKAMLRYFFENAKEVVKSPIKDKTNQSIHIDDYLGQKNSDKRFRIAYALDRIGRRIKNADERHSIDEWESILEE